MSWENLEGGQESSHHSGEIYRQRVRDYLESMEYLESGDPHSGVTDISLTRPAHNEEKEFRVETKNTKASWSDEDLCTEIARHFIDYCEQDQEFELYIFAPDYAYQRKNWRATFDERRRDPEKVEEFYDAIKNNNDLSDEEAEKLADLDDNQFSEFLGKIGVKKAGYERLGELIDENEEENRRVKKWDFYISEYGPVTEEGELLPNFVRINEYPDSVWVLPCHGVSYEDLVSSPGVRRCIPIWVENGQAFSLVSPSNLPDSIPTEVSVNDNKQIEFTRWLEEDHIDERMAKILLAKKIAWRAIQMNDACAVVKDRKIIFQTADRNTVQQTLTGDTPDKEDPKRTEITTHTQQSYLVTRRVDDAVGHRYCKPIIRKYHDGHYLFLETGWVFSRRGTKDRIISGDWATRLHHSLRREGYDQHNNYRAQLRLWKNYLRLGMKDQSPPDIAGITSNQKLRFSPPGELTLPVRPPKNKKEREDLMEGDLIAE